MPYSHGAPIAEGNLKCAPSRFSAGYKIIKLGAR